MHVVVAGGTGFLGSPLVAALRAAGDRVTVLTRQAPNAPDTVRWQPDGTAGDWAHALDGCDAVVNLAGASIAGGRWTESRKAVLRDSRIDPVRSLREAVGRAERPPAVVVSASAVGYYGATGADRVTEATPRGSGFLSDLAGEWEAAAAAIGDAGVRVILLRTGLPLASDGGVLERLLLPYRSGVGGPLGDGTQYMPWIHRADWIALVRWAIVTAGVAGPLNGSAPEPVTNNEFSDTLARVLRRPDMFRVPAFALRILLGELADALLTGQRALPARAQELGFTFRWPTLEPALRDVLQRPSHRPAR